MFRSENVCDVLDLQGVSVQVVLPAGLPAPGNDAAARAGDAKEVQELRLQAEHAERLHL